MRSAIGIKILGGMSNTSAIGDNSEARPGHIPQKAPLLKTGDVGVEIKWAVDRDMK